MKHKPYIQALQLLFEPKTGLLFLAVALIGSVFCNALCDILTIIFNLGNNLNGCFTILGGTLFIFLLILWIFAQNIKNRARYPFRFTEDFPEKRKGLILLISNYDTSEKAVMLHLGELEKCWLLYSDHPRSIESKDKICELLKYHFIEPIPIHIKDVFSSKGIRDEVDNILSHLPEGWNENDIISDFTGMTAPASIGMVLACLRNNRPLQYVPGNYDKDGRAVTATEPVEVKLEWDIALSADDKTAS